MLASPVYAEIIDFLAAGTTPDSLVAFRPSETAKQRIEDLISYNIKRDPNFLRTYSMAELEEKARLQFSYESYVAEYIGLTEKRRDELNIGFSLDPAVKYREMYNGLTLILKGDSAALRKLFKNEMEKDLIEQYNDKIKSKPGFEPVWTMKEKSLNTLIGDTAAAKINDIDDGEDLAAYLERTYNSMLKAVQKNKPILLQIAQQLNSETNGRELLLYHYLRTYLSGDFVLDIRGAVNENWNSQKKTIYKRALADLSESLYNLGYLRNKQAAGFSPELVAALKLVNEDYFRGTGDFTALNEKEVDQLVGLDIEKQRELMGLQLFISNIIKPYKYQKARYDGDFKGTKVGMTLFYTDLIMKLWSFNYQNSVPGSIPGFYPQTNYKISTLYRDELKKNPYTRSWLGPLLSGYEMYNAGKQVYFSATATRIYNASSSDLIPGIEVPAHMSSDRFSNWWNLHYQQVADYETEYHRLNQIMKWSFLIAWLKNNYQLEWLNDEGGLTRNLDFGNWYRNNKTLKVNAQVPFLNKESLGESTECIDILNSRPFQWFKENNLEYIFSGGISLVSKKSVLQKMAAIRSPQLTAKPMNRQGLSGLAADPSNFYIGETKYNISTVRENALVLPPRNAGFKGTGAEFFNLKVDRSVKTSRNKIEIMQAAGDANTVSLGGIRTERIDNTIKLSGLQNDVETYKNLFTSDNGMSYYRLLQRKVYTGNNSFLIKLDNTGCWAVGTETANGDIVRAVTNTTSKPHFKYTDGYSNYDIQFVSDREMAAGFLNNGWFKVQNRSYKVEYIPQHNAGMQARKLFVWDGSYSNEVYVEADGIFIKQHNFSIDESVARTLSSPGAGALVDAAEFDRSGVYLVKQNGLIKLSKINGPGGAEEFRIIKGMLPAEPAAIKAVVVSPDAREIRFIRPGVLEIPGVTALDPARREVLDFVMKKSSDPNWLSVFETLPAIVAEDIRVIKLISNENHGLARSYYKLKALRNLDENTAVADLQSFSAQPQVLIKKGNGQPEIRTFDMNLRVGETFEEIKKCTSQQMAAIHMMTCCVIQNLMRI